MALSLGAPLGLLAALALAPLVAAYFLRRKQPAVRVSALFLWREPSVRAEGGPRFDRFTRERSFLLEAAAVLAATWFLADARCGHVASTAPALAVVIDGSLSMSAGADHGSAATRAVAFLEERLKGAGSATLVQSGRLPRVLAGPRAPPDEARKALGSYRAQQGNHPFGPALELARDLGGTGRVLLVTNHPPDEPLPAWVEVTALGQPLENDAFTYASRSDDSGKTRVVVRVTHFGLVRRQVRIHLRAQAAQAGAPLEQDRVVDLEPGASHLFEARLERVGPVELSLPPDALDADSRITLFPTAPRQVGVALLPGLSDVEVASLSRYFRAQPEVYPAQDAKEEVALHFGPPQSSAEATLGTVGTKKALLGPFFVEKSNPLLEDVTTHGIVWTVGDNPAGRPLVTLGPHVLVALGENEQVHVNLDLARSNVQRSTAWPILLSNLTRRAWRRLPGFDARHALLGEDVRVTVPAGGRFTVVGPDGHAAVVTAGTRTLGGAGEAGDYRLEREGQRVATLTVLPVDPAESDLRGLSRGGRVAAAGGAASAPARHTRPIWPIAAMAAFLLWDYRITREER